MRFRYTPYEQQPDVAPSAVLYRPVVPVQFRGTQGSIIRLGLVDTGSDFTIAPMWIADAIGVTLPRAPTSLVTGVDGTSLETRVAGVNVRLKKAGETLQFVSAVHFAAQDYVLLGATGFLEYFRATFDWKEKWFELLPNSSLVDGSR